MSREHSKFSLATLIAATLCSAAAGGSTSPHRIVIRSEHNGWSSASTNLILTLSNGVYAAGTYTVAPVLISNLMAVAKRPWPKPGTNAWPSFTIDPANLGLNAAWLKTNYERLLHGYSGASEKGVFPNASERQRAWLTNALTDLELLGNAARESFGRMWTDDYPSLELRFEHEDGQTTEQPFRLSTRAQPAFMLPWQVYEGTNEFTSGNADISRAVFQVLPPGFLNRDRLNGDLFGAILGSFPELSNVREFMKTSTLEETLGDQADGLLQGFELRNWRIWVGSPNGYPNTLMAVLHRTNWPEGLTMPLHVGIEHGLATNLKAILSNAEPRSAPVLKLEWLMSRLKGPGDVAVEVSSDGSPDHQWLRGHMDKVGRAVFYDRIQPSLRRSLGFVLREGSRRTSQWAIFEDGRILLYGFAGNGVLDWKPEELGYQGDHRMLTPVSINPVGVFVGPEGRITEVVGPQTK